MDFLFPFSVLNLLLHICGHSEARPLEDLFGKTQQALSGEEKPGHQDTPTSRPAFGSVASAEDTASRPSIAAPISSSQDVTINQDETTLGVYTQLMLEL